MYNHTQVLGTLEGCMHLRAEAVLLQGCTQRPLVIVQGVPQQADTMRLVVHLIVAHRPCLAILFIE